MSPWRRTLWVSWVAQFFSIMGFSVVLPFLPFFIRELGVTEEASVRSWAGIVSASAPLTMIIFSPIWGGLADRYGRKLMLLRSLFGAAVVLSLMALAQRVEHLVLCRMLQGAVTGTIVASTALVASAAPPNRSVFALGMLQTAVYSGACAGPAIGGLLADQIGYRLTFLCGGASLLLAGALVAFGVKERFEPPDPSDKDARGSFRQVVGTAGFLAAVSALVAIRFGLMIEVPTFSLFVEQLLETPERKATVTGTVLGIGAVTAALCSLAGSRLTARWGRRNLLVTFAVVAAAVAAAQGLATQVIHLYVLRALLGASMAGMMLMANAMIRSVTHDRNVGRAYGVAWSLGCVGWMAGALTGGFVAAQISLRAPFFVMGCCLIGAAMIALVGIRKPRNQAVTDG